MLKRSRLCAFVSVPDQRICAVARRNVHWVASSDVTELRSDQALDVSIGVASGLVEVSRVPINRPETATDRPAALQVVASVLVVDLLPPALVIPAERAAPTDSGTLHIKVFCYNELRRTHCATDQMFVPNRSHPPRRFARLIASLRNEISAP